MLPRASPHESLRRGIQQTLLELLREHRFHLGTQIYQFQKACRVKLPKSRKDSSCHFAFIGSHICNRGRVMKSLAPTTNFLLAASFRPTAGAPLLYVLS